MLAQKPRVVIADPSEDYAIRLEDKFLRMMRDNIDLDVITDATYFHAFFSLPVHVDVALIAEQFMEPGLQNHDIVALYELTEDSSESSVNHQATPVYKYTSLSHIFNQTMGAYSNLVASRNSRLGTKVVLFFSPVGGSGKTTLAMGVATSLQENGYKVLYVDAEYEQVMGSLFGTVRPAPNSLAMTLARETKDPYAAVKQHVAHDVVDIVPPLSANLMTFGISFEVFARLVKQVKRAQDYDYVVVDTDSTFNGEKLSLIDLADSIVVPSRQDEMAAGKVAMFLNGLDMNGRKKCHVVCNAFQKSRPDALTPLMGGSQSMEAYVGFDPGFGSLKADGIARRGDVAAVSYLVR